ncbi:olfactory receptor-like protein OLF4-like [Arapaima gigas]
MVMKRVRHLHSSISHSSNLNGGEWGQWRKVSSAQGVSPIGFSPLVKSYGGPCSYMDMFVHLNSSSWCSLFLTDRNHNGMEIDRNLRISHCMFWTMLPSEAVVHILGVTFLTLCLLASTVNGCLLFGLGHSDDLSWELCFAMLKSLIISNLLFTLTQGPTVLHCLLQRHTLLFATWCLAQYFVGTICIFYTLLTITLMALERYLYVYHAIHYLNIVTCAAGSSLI